MTTPHFLPPTVAVHHGNVLASDAPPTGYHLTASTGASRAYACDRCAACSCDCLLDALAEAHALTRRHDCDVTITRVADGRVLAHTRPYRKARAA